MEKMENPSVRRRSLNEKDILKVILAVMTIGIWSLVFQNAGIIPKIEYEKVLVVNTVDVEGDVDVEGSVMVNNTVGIDIRAINGHYNAFWGKKSTNGPYYAIPVTQNWD